MQVKKQTIANKVLLELAKHLKVKGIQGVADYLGEDKNKLYAWSKRGNIADTGVILDKCPMISKQWLETGEGEMFTEKKEQPLTIAQRIGEGYTPEVKLVADYLEVKIKGKSAEERLKIIEELMDKIRSQYK